MSESSTLEAANEQVLVADVAQAKAEGTPTEPCFSCGKDTLMLAYVETEGPYMGYTIPACCPRPPCLEKFTSAAYLPPVVA